MSKHFLWGNAAINRNIEDSRIARCFPLLNVRAGAPPIGEKLTHGKRQSGYSDRPRQESRIPVQASRGPDQYGNDCGKKKREPKRRIELIARLFAHALALALVWRLTA